MTTVSSTTSSTTTSTSKASTGYSTLSSTDSGTGVDYSTLIEAKVTKKLEPADTLDTKITANEAKITAYTSLQSKLQDLEDSIAGLRNRTTSTGTTTTTNLFSQREAYLSGGGTTGADNILSATVADGTATGSYSVVVKQLATKNKIAGSTTTDKTSDQNLTGTFTLGLAGGSTATISVESTDSLADIATKINKQSSTSGVSASVLQISDNSYELVLTGTSTGKAIQLTDGGSGVTTSLGLTDSSGSIANELVATKQAEFSVDGVDMTRSSNTVSDAIDGVTLDLYSADSSNAVTVEVSSDLTSIKSAITSFVTAYNTLRTFISDQQATNTDGTASDSATLFSDSTLRQVSKAVSNIISSSVTTSDGSVLSLATLGITLNSSSQLELDEDTLNTELANNVDDVQTLLGLNYTSSDSGLMLLRYSSSSSSMSGNLDITMNSDGTIDTVSSNGDSSLFEVSGNRITGKSGTAYDGLVLVYAGDGGSMSFSATSGLFDQLYSASDGYADDTSGTLQDLIDDLQSNNDDMQTRSDDIKDRAEDYRTRLTTYYAKLEAAAETAAIQLKQLKASLNSDSSDD